MWYIECVTVGHTSGGDFQIRIVLSLMGGREGGGGGDKGEGERERREKEKVEICTYRRAYID